MANRPRLITSIPFWILIIGSLATTGYGIWLLTDKLGLMTTTLTDGTATGVEVYVGQSWAVVGAILIGVGLIGLALALTVGAVRSLVPAAAAPIVEPIDWTTESDAIEPLEGPDVEVASTETAPAAAADAPVAAEPTTAEPATTEPVAHDEPVIDAGPDATPESTQR